MLSGSLFSRLMKATYYPRKSQVFVSNLCPRANLRFDIFQFGGILFLFAELLTQNIILQNKTSDDFFPRRIYALWNTANETYLINEKQLLMQ